MQKNSPREPLGSMSTVTLATSERFSRSQGRRHAARRRFTVVFGSISALSLVALGMPAASAASAPINLGTAEPYAVLAGSTVTNTGPSVISGNIGLYPGTSITGFPPGVQSLGVTHKTDTAAQQAKSDLIAAYLSAAGRTPFNTVSADLGGSTLTPGQYQSSSSMGLTGVVTLNGGGDANAKFIFQAGSTLTTASGSRVFLENGAQACNVFWQVGSSATLGTTSNFVGTILALQSITLNHGARIMGRALARNAAVTLDDNVITAPHCSITGGGTTTTIASGSTSTTTPVIPNGAPGTGFGGTAHTQSSLFIPIGLGALGLAGLFGSLAWKNRRRSVDAG